MCLCVFWQEKGKCNSAFGISRLCTITVIKVFFSPAVWVLHWCAKTLLVCRCLCHNKRTRFCGCVWVLQGSGQSIFSTTWWCIYLPVMGMGLKQHRSARHLGIRKALTLCCNQEGHWKQKWQRFLYAGRAPAAFFSLFIYLTEQTYFHFNQCICLCKHNKGSCELKHLFRLEVYFLPISNHKYVIVCWAVTAVKRFLVHSSTPAEWIQCKYKQKTATVVVLLTYYFWHNANKL